MAKRKPEPLRIGNATYSLDGWQNVVTGLLQSSYDKRYAAVTVIETLSYSDLQTLYRSQPLAQRAVDLLPKEMTREGWDCRIDGDKETTAALAALAEDLEFLPKVKLALRWARLFGGAAILIGANDDNKDLSQPLNEKSIQSVDYLTVFDGRECTVTDWYSNAATREYGQPMFFQICPQSLGKEASSIMNRVHASRVVYFDGVKASRELQASVVGQGWGDSVLISVHNLIRDYGQTWDSVSALLQEFSQSVFKMSGVAQALLGDKDQAVINRLISINKQRSNLRGVIIDKEEEFLRVTTSLAGLPEILDRFLDLLSGALGIPATILFGQAPAGLNATGASDIRIFYDSVKAQQEEILRPVLNRLYKLLLLSKEGPTRGVEPEKWGVDFRPLWQMDDLQKAQVRSAMATADAAYLAAGVLDVEEVAKARFGGEKYSLDLSIEAEDMGEAEVEGEESEAGEAVEAEGEVEGAQKGTESSNLQSTALNGAQIASALEIVQSVGRGELPRDSGIAMLQEFFQLSPEASEKIMGSVGAGFKMAKPEPEPAPFGARPPAAPKAEE